LLHYIAKRLFAALITLMIVITIVFILVRQMPIEGYFDNFDKLDPSVIRARLAQMGLTDPLPLQLKNFFIKLFHGDLGVSARYSVGAPIAGILARKAPLSMALGLIAMALSLSLGIPLGAAMARSKAKFWDKLGAAFIAFVSAVPAAVYHIFIQAYGSKLVGAPMLFDRGTLSSWILPIFSLSLGNIAYYAMWLRRHMVDEMNKDYVTLARAKGVESRHITMAHVFRNAFVPMIQYIPNAILYTVVGSIYVESLYSVPGMGGLLVDVIRRQDNPMVQILVMIYSCVGVVGLLLGDLLMTAIDPRISFAKKEGAR